MTTATPTKPCPRCSAPMEYGPATSDDSGPGGREVEIKAGWACSECFMVEPETHAPEAADRVEGVDP